MEGGGLGEEIRLAHTLLHLLVYISSSDLVSFIFAGKFQVNLCIGPINFLISSLNN